MLLKCLFLVLCLVNFTSFSNFTVALVFYRKLVSVYIVLSFPIGGLASQGELMLIDLQVRITVKLSMFFNDTINLKYLIILPLPQINQRRNGQV